MQPVCSPHKHRENRRRTSMARTVINVHFLQQAAESPAHRLSCKSLLSPLVSQSSKVYSQEKFTGENDGQNVFLSAGTSIIYLNAVIVWRHTGTQLNVTQRSVKDHSRAAPV